MPLNFGLIRPRLKTCFESKYIVRMINAIVVNAWRLDQSYMVRYDLMHGGLTFAQIRRKLQKCNTVQDYNHNLGLQLLKTLSLEMVANREAYHTEAMAEQELQIAQKLKVTGTWPLKRNRVQQFHEGELKRMRLSSVINHQPGKKDVQKACVLCSTT